MNEMCLYTGFMNGVTSLFVPNLCSEQDNKVSGATKMTEDQYLQWDQTEFIRLRSLLVCRLTLFNARRRRVLSKDPQRLVQRGKGSMD